LQVFDDKGKIQAGTRKGIDQGAAERWATFAVPKIAESPFGAEGKTGVL